MATIAAGGRRNVLTAKNHLAVSTAGADVPITNFDEIFCGGSGNLVVIMNGVTATYAVQNGQRLPISPQTIRNTANGTTATGIVVYWS